MPNGYPSGKREFQADFIGTLGGNASITKRPDAISFDYLKAFSFGPIAVGDSSEGLFFRPWYARTDGLSVWIARAADDGKSWDAEQLVFTTVGEPIQELDVAFDQNGSPTICAERLTGVGGTKEVWLWWFNPSLGANSFDNFGAGRSPRIILDYPPDPTISDILVFYVNDTDGIVYLQQRDAYAIVHTTPITVFSGRCIEDVAFLSNWRIAVLFSDHQSDGTYTGGRLESTMYPVPVGPENIVAAIAFSSGDMPKVVVTVPGDASIDVDEMLTSLGLLSGTLVQPIIFITLNDIDQLSASISLQSGTLVVPIIFNTLFDIDKIQAAIALIGGSLDIVVVQKTLFDIDQMQASISLLSGTLA